MERSSLTLQLDPAVQISQNFSNLRIHGLTCFHIFYNCFNWFRLYQNQTGTWSARLINQSSSTNTSSDLFSTGTCSTSANDMFSTLETLLSWLSKFSTFLTSQSQDKACWDSAKDQLQVRTASGCHQQTSPFLSVDLFGLHDLHVLPRSQVS